MDTLPYPEPCLGQANGENAVTKKAIFLKIRCGRCHAGAGSAGAGITKTDRTLGIFSFQADWCHAVKQRSEHSSVEKTIRVILDYYQKACQDDAEAEQHGQRAALGSSGRACWLWAARRSQD